MLFLKDRLPVLVCCPICASLYEPLLQLSHRTSFGFADGGGISKKSPYLVFYVLIRVPGDGAVNFHDRGVAGGVMADLAASAVVRHRVLVHDDEVTTIIVSGVVSFGWA